jgi:hypothetical protein
VFNPHGMDGGVGQRRLDLGPGGKARVPLLEQCRQACFREGFLLTDQIDFRVAQLKHGKPFGMAVQFGRIVRTVLYSHNSPMDIVR